MSDAMGWLSVGGYIAGAILFSRYYVWVTARLWPRIGWSAGDTVICLAFSIVWPILFPVIFLTTPKVAGWSYPSVKFLPFRKWYERDRKGPPE